jgi:hypothetical protein
MHGFRHDDYPPVIVFGFARMERDGPVEQINLIDSKVQQFRDSPAERVTNFEESATGQFCWQVRKASHILDPQRNPCGYYVRQVWEKVGEILDSRGAAKGTASRFN